MEKIKNKQSNKQQKMPSIKGSDLCIDLELGTELKNILNKKKQYTIPIFIPHRGCNHKCIFCNQRKISGTLNDVTTKDVDELINKHLNYLKNTDKEIEIAFFGGSFTGLPIKMMIDYLEVAFKYIKSSKVKGIRLSTRPDYINSKILKILKKYSVTTIELGVQSMDDSVLEISKRGHLKIDVIKASRLIKLYKINLGHQVMVGLPKSTEAIEIETIKKLLKLKPEDLRIYPVYVISPSELYDMYKQGTYKPLTLKDAIKRTYGIVRECMKTDVRIIRMGLQSTEDITATNDSIAGPVCDNFAEYVMALIIREKIKKIISKIDLSKIDNINIIAPNRYLSIVIGPKKINRIYIEKKYKKRIIIKGEK